MTPPPPYPGPIPGPIPPGPRGGFILGFIPGGPPGKMIQRRVRKEHSTNSHYCGGYWVLLTNANNIIMHDKE